MIRFEDHAGLSDLELLTSGSIKLSPEQRERVRQVRAHLGTCRECFDAARLHGRLRAAMGLEGISAMSNCPDEQAWLEFAAGVTEEPEAQELVQHAITCDHCGRVWTEAMQDIASPVSPEELGSLKSSSAAWQQDMARMLAGESSAAQPQPPTPPKPQEKGKVLAFPRRNAWMGAVAAVLLLSVGLAGWIALRGRTDRGSESALLARGYDEQRRTDLRFPGVEAAAKAPVDRGSAKQDPPAVLSKLDLQAREQLERTPNDPYWVTIRGRVALMENDGQKARSFLEQAKASGMTGLDADLAAAYFEIGDAEHDPVAWGQAEDLYGQVIDRLAGTPDTAALGIAYFNRALCWERQSIFDKAVKDYRQALALEKDNGWRAEIERRLRDAEAIQKKSENDRSPEMDLGPGSLLAVSQKEPEALSQQYELYLEAASRSWHWSSAAENGAALQKLAAVGREHHDAWLTDMLASPATPVAKEGAQHLEAALEASLRGDPDNALKEADAAARLFRQGQNAAGVMRAKAETVYALQRSGKGGPCMQRAKALLAQPALQRYAWMHIYVLLEEASCGIDGLDVSGGVTETEEALRISRAAGLPLQALRAEGFLVTIYDMAGHTRQAWKMAQVGLEESLRVRGARMATYQFLVSLSEAADTRGLAWAAAGMAEAAAEASRFTRSIAIQAYAQEFRGRTAMAVGHYAEAEAAFALAAARMQQMPQGPAQTFYRADWATDRSALLARRGGLAEAVAQLRQAAVVLDQAGDYNTRQHHFTELASLQLRSGDAAGALRTAAAATNDAEGGLDAARDEMQKLAWERDNARGYRLLVQALIASGRVEEALRAWEWYRSAAFRKGRAIWKEDVGLQAPVLPAGRRHGLLLVVARLEDRYVVWAVPEQTDGAVRVESALDSPEQIELMARTMGELCANRSSSQDAIHVVGAKLYQSLFGRFEAAIATSTLLQLELDPSLRRLPVAALTQRDRTYLGMSHAVVQLPAWWSLRVPPEDAMPAHPRMVIVEGTGSIAGADGALVTLPAEYLETKNLAAMYPQAVLVQGQQTKGAGLPAMLESADVLHFSGHTVERQNESGLLLASPDVVFSASSLRGVSLRRSRLAVVASCSSANSVAYDLEDRGSLAHALLRAGAGHVIGTLWDVDSESSRELMVAFYGSLRQAGSPAVALQAAEQKLYDVSSTSHPFFWAASQVFIQ